MYSIHYSYYSILISVIISNSLLFIYVLFMTHNNVIILFLLFFTLWLSIIMWLMDFFIEAFIALTVIEQLALIVGMKLLLLSELMLFFACFWCYINFSLNITLLFYFPLLSCYSFSIPFTNPLMPLFSSLPIQCSQMSIKMGFLSYTIEGLAQTISCGFYFIMMQCKEFSFSYFNISDSLIGSIYYFTTFSKIDFVFYLNYWFDDINRFLILHLLLQFLLILL